MVKAFLAILLLFSPGVLLGEPPKAPPSLKRQLSVTPLDDVTLPAFTVDRATLGDALAVLSQQVKKQTKDSIQLQWVYKDLDPATWKSTVTLNAKNVSAAKVLSDILTQAKVQVKLDEHAIIVRPAGPAAKDPAPAPGGAATPKAPDNFGKNSRLDISPSLDKSSVESSMIDDELDKTPIKGRNPVKKSNWTRRSGRGLKIARPVPEVARAAVPAQGLL